MSIESTLKTLAKQMARTPRWSKEENKWAIYIAYMISRYKDWSISIRLLAAATGRSPAACRSKLKRVLIEQHLSNGK